MIQDIIEGELKKEINIKFNECIHEYHPECGLSSEESCDEYCTLCDAQDKIEKFILDFCTSQQHKLLQSIVEEIDSEKKEEFHACGFNEDGKSNCPEFCTNVEGNKVLESLKAKLLKGKSK